MLVAVSRKEKGCLDPNDIQARIEKALESHA